MKPYKTLYCVSGYTAKISSFMAVEDIGEKCVNSTGADVKYM